MRNSLPSPEWTTISSRPPSNATMPLRAKPVPNGISGARAIDPGMPPPASTCSWLTCHRTGRRESVTKTPALVTTRSLRKPPAPVSNEATTDAVSIS